LSRFHSHIHTATEILSLYKGDEPFASFIKKVFSANKKFGSRDRKQITHLCYCCFRSGHLFANDNQTERVLKSLFLCSSITNEVLAQLKPQWNKLVQLSIEQKALLLHCMPKIEEIFPCLNELSDEIDKGAFVKSHFVQPDLFLRIRPGKKNAVLQKLDSENISYRLTGDDCIGLPNATTVENILQLNHEAVVQDYSSQQVGMLIKNILQLLPGHRLSVWDCCAASGGKSIMAKDILGDIDLTVSDVRESILANLKKRFAEAGITKYQSFVADLSVPGCRLPAQAPDLIIADVPCSGSGTWGRTPEHLLLFKREQIDAYAVLQRKIISNAVAALQSGGYLLYITCSVYKKENEENVAWMVNTLSLEMIAMQLLNGYAFKADTMYAALLKKT
jgi:16S rRNA (cytosine967-C5)-methyltransferase